MPNQTPANNNSIKSQKNSLDYYEKVIPGDIANSMNGGHFKPIYYKRIMAGEVHKNATLKLHIKTLTPKSPAYQQLKMRVEAFFVPDTAVWENADAFEAQRNGLVDVNPLKYPSVGGKTLQYLQYPPQGTAQFKVLQCNTTLWRDAFISTYIPRIGGSQLALDTNANVLNKLPEYNALPLRGALLIYNEFGRNKEYQAALPVYKTDEVTGEEWSNYNPENYKTPNTKKYGDYVWRSRKNNSYYVNYRTQMQGLEIETPVLDDDQNSLAVWSAWESKMAEARSEATNAQKRYQTIISEIRGVKEIKTDRPEKIGEKIFNLNYAAVTQNTYNTNENITAEYQTMGTQGAFSYTEINLPLYKNHVFLQTGTLHIFATVTADVVYENGFERTMLNVGALDQYRPDLKDDKLDVIYKLETGWDDGIDENYFTEIYGFKRKYSELVEKAPIIIGGDMNGRNYFEDSGMYGGVNNVEIETQKTYQFYEDMPTKIYNGNQYYKKLPYLDYTDVHLSRNQAIVSRIVETEDDLIVTGQNQIFFAGKIEFDSGLPISPDIDNNKTNWGEH